MKLYNVVEVDISALRDDKTYHRGLKKKKKKRKSGADYRQIGSNFPSLDSE